MSTKRIKAGLKIPSSELKPEGRIATLIREDNGPEALVGFMMLLGMDGVDGDLTIHAGGQSIPLGRENIENLFVSWMPQCNAREAVSALLDAGLMDMSAGQITVPLFEQFVHTEGLSAGRMRTMREKRKGRDTQSVERNECVHGDAIEAHNVTEGVSQCDASTMHNVMNIPSQSDNPPQKEKEAKRKKLCEFKEREEIDSPSLPIASSCLEESVSGWREEARCGAPSVTEHESAGGADAELMSRAAHLLPAGNTSAMLGSSAGDSIERGGKPHRPEPLEVAKNWPISTDAKLLLQKFAEKSPSLQLKDSCSPESLTALVDDALRSRPLKDILRVFELAEESNFLTGRDGKMRNAPVTLDWILQPANFERILRGELGDYRKNTRQMNIRRDEFAIQFFN